MIVTKEMKERVFELVSSAPLTTAQICRSYRANYMRPDLSDADYVAASLQELADEGRIVRRASKRLGDFASYYRPSEGAARSTTTPPR